jgi:hypothetical protein
MTKFQKHYSTGIENLEDLATTIFVILDDLYQSDRSDRSAAPHLITARAIWFIRKIPYYIKPTE